MSDEIFEGDDVTDYLLVLPTGTTEAPTAYPHGTVLTIELQVRVKSVQLAEDRKGNLIRKHALSVEDVRIVESLTPAERRAILDHAFTVDEPELAEVQF